MQIACMHWYANQMQSHCMRASGRNTHMQFVCTVLAKVHILHAYTCMQIFVRASITNDKEQAKVKKVVNVPVRGTTFAVTVL